jgi:hypothetical protein
MMQKLASGLFAVRSAIDLFDSHCRKSRLISFLFILEFHRVSSHCRNYRVFYITSILAKTQTHNTAFSLVFVYKDKNINFMVLYDVPVLLNSILLFRKTNNSSKKMLNRFLKLIIVPISGEHIFGFLVNSHKIKNNLTSQYHIRKIKVLTSFIQSKVQGKSKFSCVFLSLKLKYLVELPSHMPHHRDFYICWPTHFGFASPLVFVYKIHHINFLVLCMILTRYNPLKNKIYESQENQIKFILFVIMSTITSIIHAQIKHTKFITINMKFLRFPTDFCSRLLIFSAFILCSYYYIRFELGTIFWKIYFNYLIFINIKRNVTQYEEIKVLNNVRWILLFFLQVNGESKSALTHSHWELGKLKRDYG